MNTQVLALFGSPRRGGNTDILTEELLSGISRDGGVDINRVYICDNDIKPCTGCSYCEKTGECNIDDEMKNIYPLIERSHVIVVASPVYFYGVSAQCKLLIDRCHVFWARKYILKQPWSVDDELIRQGFFITAAGTGNPSLFKGGELTISYFFDCIDVLYQGAVKVKNVQEKEEVRKNIIALKEAYVRGAELMNPY